MIEAMAVCVGWDLTSILWPHQVLEPRAFSETPKRKAVQVDMPQWPDLLSRIKTRRVVEAGISLNGWSLFKNVFWFCGCTAGRKHQYQRTSSPTSAIRDDVMGQEFWLGQWRVWPPAKEMNLKKSSDFHRILLFGFSNVASYYMSYIPASGSENGWRFCYCVITDY